MPKDQRPPQLFLRFFRWYCHPKLVDHIEGDLMEDYGDRLKKIGKRKADTQFIIDVLLLFRPGIIRPKEGYQNLNNYGMLKSYFKIGWRNIIKNKTFSTINILGLSIAMASAMIIMLYANDELSYDRLHAQTSNIYRLVHRRVNADGSLANTGGNSGYLQGPTFQANIPEIEAFTRLKSVDLEVRQDDNIHAWRQRLWHGAHTDCTWQIS